MASIRENEKGQTLYPRYEWFKEVVKVFEDSGRSVPVFNDKHLSTAWRHCAEMVGDSKTAGIPLPGRVVASGDVAIAADRYAFRRATRRKCVCRLRRGG